MFHRRCLRIYLPLAYLCLLSVASAASAQPDKPRYAGPTWTIEHGLPQNGVGVLLQSADGYLWIGTESGLARFDGVAFTIFNTGNTPSLASHRILSLAQGRDGTLWIGTEHGGVARFDRGTFVVAIPQEALPGQFVHALVERRDGTLWIGTDRGLAASVATTGTPVAVPAPLRDANVFALNEDSSGALWIGSNRGLARYERGELTSWAERDGKPLIVRAIAADKNGVIWLATERGLARVDNGAVVAAGGDNDDAATSLAIDPGGAVWVGSGRGLVRSSGNSRWRYTAADGLVDGAIRTVLVDREGSLWIAGGAGLTRWRPSLFRAYTRDDGLLGRGVLPIIEDRDGRIWVGTCAGITAIGPASNVTYAQQDGLANPCARTFHVDRHARLWVGSAQNGVYIFDGSRFAPYTVVPGLDERAISAMLETTDGATWIGTDAGLLRVGDREYAWRRRADGLVHDDIRALAEAADGALWIGTSAGLSRYHHGVFTNYTRADGLPADYVRDLHADADGTLWIGTFGGGLSRLKDGHFTNYNVAVGLADDVASRILDDGAGNFWISGNRGIFRVSRRELEAFAGGTLRRIHSIRYGVAEGMPTAETNGGAQPAGWRARDGRLWFPTMGGAVVIDPRHAYNLESPPVAVERVVVDDRVVPTAAGLELAPGRHSVSIHYTALSFVAPERVQFKYMLEGYDRAWTEAGERRTAYYTSVPPGSYRFRVIAGNQGVWNEVGAALTLIQRPHLYQTRWFAGVMLIAALLLGRAGYRWRVAHLLRRTRALETKVAERTAELVVERNRLADANSSLARANADLLTTLSGLRLGVVIVGPDDTVLFMSPATEQLLGQDAGAAIGTRWQETLTLDAREASQIEAAARMPAPRRAKVPVRLKIDGRTFWLEIDVQDDPRDPSRRMLFLYDVSQVYDLRRLLDERAQFHGLVGHSRAMQLVFKQLADVGTADTTVLIEGDTGTGKELAARAIHYLSRRRHKAFVPVNCAALTESLLGSQLFGHRRGAFTGAVADQIGLFEAADGGTIFLDEIGDVPAAVQTSLLRVLQEREITRVGEVHPRKIDVRVIAASNRNLDREVADGRFRQDLLYRIRVVRVTLPPLRERVDDIPLLVAWFLGQARAVTGKPVQDVSHEAMEILMEHPWPGNVRELKSAIESATLRSNGSVIQPADLPAEILRVPANLPFIDGVESERQRLYDAIARADGNRTVAARRLGISRATLYRRLATIDAPPPA